MALEGKNLVPFSQRKRNLVHSFPFGRRSTADEVAAACDLSGKTALVTGANTGIGFETARALSSRGARTILACRNPDTGNDAVARIRARHPEADVELAVLDLASLDRIRRFAAGFTGKLHILVCNAGLFGGGYHETEDGFERTVGVCHIGHFLLTMLLLRRLEAAGAARVVVVSSHAHRYLRRLDFDCLPLSSKTHSNLRAYGQAKLCNILFAKECQRRYADRGMTALSLHPGTLLTGIVRNSMAGKVAMRLARPFTRNLAQGAATSVYCAAYPGLERYGGEYFVDCRPGPSSRESSDPEVARRLWQQSEKWTGPAG
jgi:WW domain-containing oxidoreductase